MPLSIKHQPSVLTPDGIELDREGFSGGTTPKWLAHDQRRGQKASSRGQKARGFCLFVVSHFARMVFSFAFAFGSGSILGALSTGNKGIESGDSRGEEFAPRT